MGAPLAVLGTAISYKSSMDQARAMEYQAQAARQQAEYNATIQRQNAAQDQQVANYQAKGQERKKTDNLIALERSLEAMDRKGSYEISKLRNSGAYQGADFDFVLESSMDDIFSQEVDQMIKSTTLGAQYDAQSEELRRQGLFAYNAGLRSAELTIHAGNNKANDLENSASTTRLNALGNAAYGFSEASQMED
jgi:hypothetical protein